MSFDLPEVASKSGWEQLSADRPMDVAPRVPPVQRVPLRRFFSGGDVIECADRAVEAILSEAESGLVAEIPALHLAAAGATVAEVVSELSEQVVHFFNFYTALDADEVIGDAVRLRALYRRDFRRAIAQAA